MSGVGLDWYKRQPIAFLKDARGLAEREFAVYALIVDLLYIHGGTIDNDPKFLAGHFEDIGAAAVRRSIAKLDANPKITLTVTETEITQKRAKNEAKTREKLRENRRETGKKGGESSAKKRATYKENNDLAEPSASPEIQAEKRREEKSIGGGGSARTRDDPTFREKILQAIGVDPVSGLTGRGSTMIGTTADMLEASRWTSDLQLTEEECIQVIAELITAKPDGPPSRFTYFTGAMQRLAGEKQKPEITAIEGKTNGSARNTKPSGADIAKAAGERWAARSMDRG